MLRESLRLVHFLGLSLISAGLIGVFLADLRSRQARTLAIYVESVRWIALFYDGLVVPGALLLAGSGVWLVSAVWGGWAALGEPWLAGMAGLFLFEAIEGNTLTRVYFRRLRRAARAALAAGAPTPELARLRASRVPTFAHFLDLPLLFVIVALGVFRPESWLPLLAGCAIALTVAALLTALLPRLYAAEPPPA